MYFISHTCIKGKKKFDSISLVCCSTLVVNSRVCPRGTDMHEANPIIDHDLFTD